MAQSKFHTPGCQDSPGSVYIHFPYCLYKCHYCDFNSHATQQEEIPHENYFKALLAELDLRKNIFEKEGKHFYPPSTKIRTVFFGGGTPSLMHPSHVEKILKKVGDYFSLESNVEITLETNPKTVTSQKLGEFKNAGINRLSLGVQSLNDNYLHQFGRIHSANEARQTIEAIKKTFSSWNVDLIYGFPNQTFADWKNQLEEAIGFNPPHLSCYSLTVEEGTSFAKDIRDKKITPPDSDIQGQMFEHTHSFLEEHGYEGYEVSNFCKPGFESIHNLNYWNYGTYVGLGAGAVSFLHSSSLSSPSPSRGEGYRERVSVIEEENCHFGYRTTNYKSPSLYQAGLHPLPSPPPSRGRELWVEEAIDQKTAIQEFIMMGLRLKKGLDEKQFQKLFGISLEKKFADVLKNLRQKGHLSKDKISLTPQGRIMANQVILDFI